MIQWKAAASRVVSNRLEEARCGRHFSNSPQDAALFEPMGETSTEKCAKCAAGLAQSLAALEDAIKDLDSEDINLVVGERKTIAYSASRL
jgi:hypothetical protein